MMGKMRHWEAWVLNLPDILERLRARKTTASYHNSVSKEESPEDGLVKWPERESCWAVFASRYLVLKKKAKEQWVTSFIRGVSDTRPNSEVWGVWKIKKPQLGLGRPWECALQRSWINQGPRTVLPTGCLPPAETKCSRNTKARLL